MKKVLLALGATTLLSGCFGVSSSLSPSATPRPWSLDPQAAYAAELEAEESGQPAAEPLQTADNSAAAATVDVAQADPAAAPPRDNAFRKGCEMIIRTVWAETERGRYVIEAESKSESCENAALSLAIRAPNRVVVYRANLEADEVYGFTDIETPLEMRGALIDWATNYGSLTRRSGRLPYWPRGAVQPVVAGAYPMIVDEAWDRVTYLQVRAANVPVYCHILDLESMACMVLHDAQLDVVQLGVQTFPRRADATEASAEAAADAGEAVTQ